MTRDVFVYPPSLPHARKAGSREKGKMGFLHRCVRFINGTTRAINILSMATIFGIMVLTIIGIIARVSGVPISGITNLSESLLVIAIYLSVAYTQQNKEHVSVEFLIASLPTRWRRIFVIINVLIPMLICSIIVLTSWEYALSSWRVREKMDGAPFYPIYPPKIAVAVGISLLWLQLVADLMGAIMGFLNESQRANT